MKYDSAVIQSAFEKQKPA